MSQLVLSLFPGIGLLDMAFEEEGFCVVRGPDLLWGGDIRRFHPPAGKFDGVIGGPPCPAFSSAANVARAAGKTVKADLIPEFARVVREVAPRWWVMENTTGAYPPAVGRCFVADMDNRWVGGTQHRVRRFWSSLELFWGPDLVTLEAVERQPTACTSIWKNGRQQRATSRKDVERVRIAQDLPADFALPAFRVEVQVQAIVNGVPLPMGRAVARAVKRALGPTLEATSVVGSAPGATP